MCKVIKNAYNGNHEAVKQLLIQHEFMILWHKEMILWHKDRPSKLLRNVRMRPAGQSLPNFVIRDTH
jgi:hypothetical protein